MCGAFHSFILIEEVLRSCIIVPLNLSSEATKANRILVSQQQLQPSSKSSVLRTDSCLSPSGEMGQNSSFMNTFAISYIVYMQKSALFDLWRIFKEKYGERAECLIDRDELAALVKEAGLHDSGSAVILTC